MIPAILLSLVWGHGVRRRGVLTRLDHLVILVRDLDPAVRDYERLGFAVTPGGEHADGLTRNALIPFEDGSYLELVAFVDPEDVRDNVWGWRRFLSSGGGLIDYCAASDDLREEVRGLEERDLGVDGPTDGGRRLPDGREIRWRIARIRQDGRLLPFLIEDLSPRELRVPGGPSAEHPIGALGISRLEVATPDAEEAVRAFASLAGTSGNSETPLRLGPCALSLVTPEQEDEARGRLDASGPGPLAVGLATDGPGRAEKLDRRLSHGVRIRLLGRAAGG
jgi:catechol 2,3-dioxygenase-like lactoylglutathione lyase family enzyme